MPEDFSFKCTHIPEGSRPLSGEEWENIALAKFAKCQRELEEALWGVIQMYQSTGRPQIALDYLHKVLSRSVDPQRQGQCYYAMGCTMERLEDYTAAISCYTRALQLEPLGGDLWYFIHNNLGFCLNHFERFNEAEPYIRRAIEINPDRYNAHKNLGVSLEGQGDLPDAARCYIEAVRLESSDPRALAHLENLFAHHPELAREIPDFAVMIERCRIAVATAREERAQRFREAANRNGV